jgi:hypothetical protein
MSYYSNDPASCRVDFFKTSGKWYTTEAVDFDGTYEMISLDAFAFALVRHLTEPDGKVRLEEMTAVCLDPHVKHPYPLMIPVAEAVRWSRAAKGATGRGR